MVLPPIDDLVHPTSLLPERMPSEVEILKLEFEIERRVNREKIMRFQEDLRQRRYDMEIQRDHIQKRDQKYELLLQDFKELGLENARLKKESKDKKCNLNKRIKLEEDKKPKRIFKEVGPSGQRRCS